MELGSYHIITAQVKKFPVSHCRNNKKYLDNLLKCVCAEFHEI